MTLVFTGTEREALQQGPTGSFTEGNSAGYYDSAQSRGYSTLDGGASTYYDFPFTADDDVWIHFRRRYYGFSDGSAQPTIQFMDASNNVLARLRQIGASNYGMEYWNGSAFVAVGSTNPHPASIMHIYDLHVKRHASAGVVEWYYDNALQGQGTGLNTSSFGTMTHIRIVWGTDGGSAISEVVINTGGITTVGWGVTTFPPVADGADTAGTGTFADVDELITNTADFVALDTAGQQHCFTKGTHTYINEIAGVCVAAKIRVADGTGPQQVKPYLRIGGVRYYGTTFALTTGFVNYQYIWLLDPSTGLAWDYLDVGSDTYMQFGWEAVA